MYPVNPKIGAPELCENTDGESGPMLDLKLSCCDNGLIDNLRIQDPFEDIESRVSSGERASPCFVEGRLVDNLEECAYACEEGRRKIRGRSWGSGSDSVGVSIVVSNGE